MTKTKSPLRRFTDKLFGGLNMSWVKVIIFAVAAAVVTTVFLVVPVFDGTSFHEMGVYFESWILFAFIIMSNCSKPLESALKTFVFFLISQPLIYLFQVPFSYQGWGLFGYYRFWFILTLCTFPAAFVGWFIRKSNWLSLLILSPVIVLLTVSGIGYLTKTINNFPDHILAAVFCFGQTALYLYAFFEDWKKSFTGLIPVVVTAAVIMFNSNSVDISLYTDLPGSPSFSDAAVIELGNPEFGEASITDAENGEIYIHMKRQGTTYLTVLDGEKVYSYSAEVKDINGVKQIEITPR